jgi:acetyl-CoA synthetase
VPNISISEFTYDNDETGLTKELTLQVRKVIGPFAAPKKIYVVGDLPKTRSGKVRLFYTMTVADS